MGDFVSRRLSRLKILMHHEHQIDVVRFFFIGHIALKHNESMKIAGTLDQFISVRLHLCPA